jgi:hypothetical protein
MDEFIDVLTADLKPVRPRNAVLEIAALAGLLAVELALWLLAGNMRPGLGQVAMSTPTFWWKIGAAAVLMASAGVTAVSSFDPTVSPRRGLMWLAAGFALFLIIGVVLDIDARLGFSALTARAPLRGGLECMSYLVSLSVPPMVAFGLMMRRGAPTNMRGTALACGLAAAGWGALVFAFTCPHDDPVFIAVWYPASTAFSTLVAWLVLPRVSRW